MTQGFDVTVAKKYGVIAAILVDTLQMNIAYNRANGINLVDGKTWDRSSVKAYSLQHPYLGICQIKRALDSLCTEGVLEKGNYNDTRMDKTSWYAFVNEGEWFRST